MRRVSGAREATHAAEFQADAGGRGFGVARRLARPLPWKPGMSQKSVEIVIGRIATDEALRARFRADPAGTLRFLGESGLALSLGELEALLEIPDEFWTATIIAIHPRLQKVALKGTRDER